MRKVRALVVGASDLGTACVLRLVRAGIKAVILEHDCPLDIYHSRSFSSAVFSGSKTIDGITTKTYARALDESNIQGDTTLSGFVDYTLQNREVPIVLASDKENIKRIAFNYIIISDAALFDELPQNLNESARLIGFHKTINTGKFSYTVCNALNFFGRVFYPRISPVSPGDKNSIHKKNKYELIKSPIEGVFQSTKSVNDRIHEKDEIGKINNIPILSPVSGRISGLLNSGIIVPAGVVFAEVDESFTNTPANFVSNESMCLAGAVLEAVLYDQNLNMTE